MLIEIYGENSDEGKEKIKEAFTTEKKLFTITALYLPNTSESRELSADQNAIEGFLILKYLKFFWTLILTMDVSSD